MERKLVPAVDLEVLEVDGVGRTMRLRTKEGDITISQETAAKVWVLPV
jgi:hypothetical protein